ncbi:AraC family transcriptional regulator [Hymenobacter koreensis]|uniref:HTH araC/xylS-type domain-containing protein n=1 Tax=Hymenobacter koreensis TaxID=1084523 RepID=A0ABP8IWI1_9BACT
MLRTAFPDLLWLKREVAHRFADGRGWPSVIIQARPSGPVHRPDVCGPLSLFMNLAGASTCAVGQRRVRIETDTYFLSNRAEHYTLAVEEPGETETFNIHFGDQLAETALRDLTTPADRLLDDPRGPAPAVEFYSRLYPKDESIRALVGQIRQHAEAFNANALLREQLLLQLVAHLLGVHHQAQQVAAQLPAVKRATQQEIFRRLSWSVDYLHSYYPRDLSLDELAEVACLSKFHYLRLFRALHGQTPYAYLRQLRLRKGQELLQIGQLPVGAVAELVGFESTSAFGRALHQSTGLWPSALLPHGGAAGAK